MSGFLIVVLTGFGFIAFLKLCRWVYIGFRRLRRFG